MLRETELIRILRGEIGPSQKAWCQKHGISEPYVSQVLSGAKTPGDKIAKALGFRKVRPEPHFEPMT